MFDRKWLIYHKEKELNDFGLKIRIFDISNIKFLKKKDFYWKLFHVTFKYHLLKYSNTSVPGKAQGFCWKLKCSTLNLFCRVYILPDTHVETSFIYKIGISD